MFNYVPMKSRLYTKRRMDPTYPPCWRARVLVMALALSLGTVLGALPGPVQAQEGNGKYGFVNISQVITQSDEGLAEAEELESLGAEKQQELAARKQELEELVAQYEKSTEDGDPDAQLREQIKKLQRELERDVRQAQSDVDVSRQDRIQQIGTKVVQIVQKFAKDNNYTAIFRIDNGQMLYVDAAVDITPQVLEAYNKAYPAE